MSPCNPLLFVALCVSPLAAQESAAPFDAPLVVSQEPGTAPFRGLLDYDGDGHLDAIAVTDNDLTVWHNDGNGRLVPLFEEVLLGAVQSIQHVKVGNFDGNPFQDFALAEKDGYRIHLSQGDGTFVSTTYQTTPDLIDIAVGDFEGDGVDEVAAVLGAWNDPSEIEIFLSSGIYLHTTTSITNATGLVAFEADGEFTDDLLVAQDNIARIYRVDPTGFIPADTFSVEDSVTHDWAAGDIDGDLDCDVVCFTKAWGPAVYKNDVFERIAPSGFLQHPTAEGGRASELWDIDGDGDLDGIHSEDTDGPGTGPVVTFQSTFFVAINEGGFAFAESFEIPMVDAFDLGGVGDLDNDGDTDIVAGRCVYYARGPMTASPMPQLPFNPFTFRDHLIGDADRDGDPDPYSIYGPWNMGDGTFADVPQPEFPDVPAGQSISGPNWFGDFNGDGAWDTIYTRYDSSGGSWEFMQQELVLNSGGGGYVLAGPASPPGEQFEPYENSVDNGFSGDGDDDGDTDLFIRANGFGGSITTVFYQNDGTGFFQPVWSLFKTRGELLADFNNDGHSDMFGTGSNESPTFRVFVGLPGDSAPYFDGPIEVASNVDPEEERQYTAADFNDDGWMDIAFVDRDGQPQLWFNTTSSPGASPTFATADFFGPAYETNDDQRPRVVGLDANGDGLTDVAVGPFWQHPGSAFVFLRKPGTSGVLTLADYEEPILQVLTGLYPSDVDGDGDTDLFGATISYNTTFDPAYGGGSRVQSEPAGAGTDGMIPVLGGVGPFRAGETTKLSLSGAVGGTLSVLIFSQQQANLPNFPLPGVATYVDPFVPGFAQIQIPVIGPAGVGGAGTWDPAAPGFLVPAGIAGLTFHHQAFVIDPGSPTLAVHSNRLSITYGS